MCTAFTFDFEYGNSTILLIGDVYCPNTTCSGKHCLHKKNFQSLGRSDYKYSQCASVCQVGNIPFEDQTNYFFLSFGQGVYIFKESPKSTQGVIGEVFCPGKYCFNREKCESLDGYLTTPRSIHGCGKSGVWLFVLIDDKNRQNKFFSLLRKLNLVPNKRLLLNVPFESNKYKKKE